MSTNLVSKEIVAATRALNEFNEIDQLLKKEWEAFKEENEDKIEMLSKLQDERSDRFDIVKKLVKEIKQGVGEFSFMEKDKCFYDGLKFLKIMKKHGYKFNELLHLGVVTVKIDKKKADELLRQKPELYKEAKDEAFILNFESAVRAPKRELNLI